MTLLFFLLWLSTIELSEIQIPTLVSGEKTFDTGSGYVSFRLQIEIRTNLLIFKLLIDIGKNFGCFIRICFRDEFRDFGIDLIGGPFGSANHDSGSFDIRTYKERHGGGQLGLQQFTNDGQVIVSSESLAYKCSYIRCVNGYFDTDLGKASLNDGQYIHLIGKAENPKFKTIAVSCFFQQSFCTIDIHCTLFLCPERGVIGTCSTSVTELRFCEQTAGRYGCNSIKIESFVDRSCCTRDEPSDQLCRCRLCQRIQLQWLLPTGHHMPHLRLPS